MTKHMRYILATHGAAFLCFFFLSSEASTASIVSMCQNRFIFGGMPGYKNCRNNELDLDIAATAASRLVALTWIVVVLIGLVYLSHARHPYCKRRFAYFVLCLCCMLPALIGAL